MGMHSGRKIPLSYSVKDFTKPNAHQKLKRFQTIQLKNAHQKTQKISNNSIFSCPPLKVIHQNIQNILCPPLKDFTKKSQKIQQKEKNIPT